MPEYLSPFSEYVPSFGVGHPGMAGLLHADTSPSALKGFKLGNVGGSLLVLNRLP